MDGSIVIGVELEDSAFTAALNRLRQTAGQTATAAMNVLSRSISQVTSAFRESAAAGSNWSSRLTGLFRQVITGATAVTPALETQGRLAGTRYLAALSAGDYSGTGRRLAQGVLQGLGSGNYTAAGAEAASKILGGFASGRGNLVAAAQAQASGIRGAFSGGWYSVGYNISAGIASGVRSGSYLISQAAMAAARSALAAAKQTLGVQSPSRVFREQVGRMIPAGIAQGVAAGQPEVEAAVRRQSETLVKAARQDVTPALSRLTTGPQSAAPASVRGDIRLTVESPLVLDGRELARATAKYTGQQLMWEAM